MNDDLPTLPELGDALRLYLVDRGIGLREAERELGISKATLSRACRGMNMSATHYRALVKKVWLPAN